MVAAKKDTKSERIQLLEQAESLLIRLNAENREPTLGESQFLAFDVGWDDREIRRQRSRCKNIFLNQQIAGESKDREALDKAEVEASKALEEQAPTLEAEIEERVAKLNALKNNVNSIRKRQEQVRSALSILEQSVPQHVLDYVNKNRGLIARSPIGQKVLNLEGEIGTLESVVDRSLHRDDFSHIACVQRFDASAVISKSREEGGALMLCPNRWPALKQECLARLPEAKKELAVAQAAKEKALEENRAALRLYWR